jgi:hypothetical protein
LIGIDAGLTEEQLFPGWEVAHPGDVFSDDVEFQVYGISRMDSLDVSMLKGIRNDGDIEFRLFDIKDGKAGSVEANGAFFDDKVAEFLWEFEAEFPAAVELLSFNAGGGGIDMALDDMTVEPAVHDHAAFEVYEVAELPGSEVGLLDSLFDGGYAVAISSDLLYGQAHTIVRNALVNFQLGGEGRLDPEYFVTAGGFDGSYRAEGFDDSGKHGVEIRKKWGEFSVLQKNIVLLPSVNLFKHAHYRFQGLREH